MFLYNLNPQFNKIQIKQSHLMDFRSINFQKLKSPKIQQKIVINYNNLLQNQMEIHVNQQLKKAMIKSVVIDPPSQRIKVCSSKEEFFTVKNHNKKKKQDQCDSKHNIGNNQNETKDNQDLQILYFDKCLKNTLTTTAQSEYFLKFRKRKTQSQKEVELEKQKQKQCDKENNRAKNVDKQIQGPNKKYRKFSQHIMYHSMIETRKIGQNIKIQDFRLLEKLGQGTYSQVYQAIHLKTNLMVALKVLVKQRMRVMKVEQNVIRQIKIQQYLNHPNLLQLYGYFHDDTNIYLICEYCMGGNCYEMIKNIWRVRGVKGLQPEEASKIVNQLCKGVNYMHSYDVMHRDIKPENMLLTMGDTLKLCDFGWAVYNPANGLRKTICGTPLYLAPQLIQQIQYTQTIDVWAIGVLTYELLTGKMPFQVRQIRELCKIVKQEVNYELITNQAAKDFIIQTLVKDGENRSQINQLINHKFLKLYEVGFKQFQ